MGVTNTTISEYEGGTVDLSISRIIQFIDVFEVSIEEFLPIKSDLRNHIKIYCGENIKSNEMDSLHKIFSKIQLLDEKECKIFIKNLENAVEYHNNMISIYKDKQ